MVEKPCSSFNFQEMLETRENRLRGNNLRQQDKIGKHMRAEQPASLFDFVTMVAMIVSKVMPDVEFCPDEGAIIKDSQKRLEKPVILYQVNSREAAQELKTRYAEALVEEIDEVTGRKRHGHNYSQRFNCIVQFNVVADTYQKSEDIINRFEELMMTYSGYYKSKGVAEILFYKYFTDHNYDPYRQWLSVRSISYFVQVEKVVTIFDTTIADIELA